MHLLNNLIREGAFIKLRARYQGLSPLARDLIEGLMCKDVDQRLTVQQAFKHPWLKHPLIVSDDENEDSDNSDKSS